MTEEQDEIAFEKAEFEEQAPKRSSCLLCEREVGETWWEVGGRLSCAPCRDRYDAELKQAYSLRTFGRATWFGGGAALVGSIAWYWFGKITGYELSLIAILIGIVIGIAIKRATGGHGGRRYQILAVFLTYSAIVWTYVPHFLDEIAKHKTEQVAPGAGPVPSVVGVAPVVSAAPAAAPAQPVEKLPPPTLGQFLGAWALLIAFAYAAPFLGGTQGLIGLLIIGIGLFEAFRQTRRTTPDITGPYRADER